jgi:hypothetical protein
VIPKKRYTLFLRSPCGYACGDYEASALGRTLFNSPLLDAGKAMSLRERARRSLLAREHPSVGVLTDEFDRWSQRVELV